MQDNSAAQAVSLIERLKYRPAPQRLARRRREITPSQEAVLRTMLATHQFREPVGYLDTAEGRRDMEDHVWRRLHVDRRTVVGWLDGLTRLDGARVVEIGCGTGASTVALAEQGARVVGYDIDAGALAVADKRRELFNLDSIRLNHASAVEIDGAELSDADFVVFFASLEHMTLDERIAALSRVWSSLKTGAFLVVIDAPNRLWWFDSHTSSLPFYGWLPDDLAVLYARFSPRAPFNRQIAAPVDAASILALARVGRGVSYHEFELAIGDLSGLRVSSLNGYNRRNPLRMAKWLLREVVFERMLRSRGPNLPAEFYEPQLSFAIQKP